ncbi:hypothetical protein [Dubosiella newyorkensis]|uniref:hypothetical protein n=1 Tax=Dubosiella newyorkensis TaxID=1862672 RepID=UPI002574360D|nr:hypothetical protein [Dubosiella newyorkensis]
MDSLTYSALIFEPAQEHSYSRLEEALPLFEKDPNCAQIVICCQEDWLLKLSLHPHQKTILVQMSKHPYVSMVNGLKAVCEDSVLVLDLNRMCKLEDKQRVLKKLQEYPAIYCHASLQGFDTRLLMFCLQYAIEQNAQIENYTQAVCHFGDTPLVFLE